MKIEWFLMTSQVYINKLHPFYPHLTKRLVYSYLWFDINDIKKKKNIVLSSRGESSSIKIQRQRGKYFTQKSITCSYCLYTIWELFEKIVITNKNRGGVKFNLSKERISIVSK